MQAIKYLRRTPAAIAIATLGLGAASPALAFKFDLDNGVTGSFDSTISYGVQRRMQSPNKGLVSNDNGGSVPTTGQLGRLVNPGDSGFTSNPDFNYTNVDDGNLNYKKGDIVSSVLKGTHEVALKEQGNWAMLGRVTWSTDFSAYHTERSPLADDARKSVKQNISLLDLWVSKDLQLGDQSAKIKLGNQVISWGEDIFIFGGINSINAFDMRKAHIPGTQLKEIFIPAPMVSFSSSLGQGLSLETYYQFRWNGFKLDPAGTYWSTADFLGKGGKRGAFIPTSYFGSGDYDPTQGRTMDYVTANGGLVPVEKEKPKQSGQFGLSMRFTPRDSDTEYAAYYMRYHDKLPFVGYRFDSKVSNVFTNALGYGIVAVEQYGQDKDLFGLSMNTKLGEWAVGAEISYRPKDSVAIDPTVPLSGRYSVFTATTGSVANGYINEKKFQAHVTGFRFLPQEITRALGAADGYFMGEMAVTHYPGLKLNGEVPYLLNDYSLPTKTSFGYVAEFGLTYANVLNSGWTMSPIVDFYHDVKGTSPNTIPFVEGRKAVALGLNFDYHNQWKVGFGYSTFFGGGALNLLKDRDVATAMVSYTF